MKRAMVAEVMTTHALSQRRACGLIGITRRGFQRAPAEDRNHQLRQRLRELAENDGVGVVRCSTWCCAAKAGAPITNASSGCIVKKAFHCADGGAANA